VPAALEASVMHIHLKVGLRIELAFVEVAVLE
jgi:hypothetical protein